MKTVYIITYIILWILIILQILLGICSSKLLKQQLKSLGEAEELIKECETVRNEMLEEKQKYREAKERLLATMLPDIEDSTHDDAPPQEEGEPEFLFSHKNGEIIIQAARCDLEWLASEIGYVTHRLYCGLHSKEPESAQIFRDYVTMTIAEEDSPTWDTSIANVENMVIIPKLTEEDGADEA